MKLIVIDDDPIVSSSLKTILEIHDGIEVIAIGNDGSVALELYQKHHPDILLIDIRMTKMNGVDAARQILEFYPQAKIVFLTTFKDDEYVHTALEIGAKGYLLKQDFETIALALKSIMAGQVVFGGDIIHSLNTRKNRIHTNADLSEKEIELLECIAQGHNNKELASILGYSEGTVRNQISVLLEKLALRDRTQLAIYYFNHLQK